MNKRYKELLEIVTKFPFLKSSVTSNIREVYTNAEFLDYKNFLKEYDYSTDLFGLANKTPKYFRGSYYTYSNDNKVPFKDKEDVLLYNLISSNDTSYIYNENYPVLVEISNLLLDHFNVDESKLSLTHFDEYSEPEHEADKELRNIVKAVGYIADTFAFGESFTKYIRTITESGKSQFIEDILNGAPAVKQLNKLCKFINIRSRNMLLEYYVAGKANICNLINAAVAKVYDSYTPEDIELFKTKAKLVSNIFDYFNLKIEREVSLLNNHISEEERSELTKNFTSADDIAELTKTVINSFTSENSFDGDKINSIIRNIIVGNKKIRDRDFPTTKNKVVHEFLRLLFITNKSSRDFTGDERYSKEINKVIENNTDYVLDPYFITSILLKESVISDHYTDTVKNSKKFMRFVLNTPNKIDTFIDSYIRELSKPVNERVSTVKGVKSNIISYGTLYYIISQYGEGKLNVVPSTDNEGHLNVVKLLLMTYGKHRDDIRKELLENTGCRESSNYYYNEDNQLSISKALYAITNPGRGADSYCSQVIGNDGVDRTISLIEKKYYGSFNHIMSYLLDEDSDFDYNENHSIGVKEGSRYSYSSKNEKAYVPKKYYDYIRTAVKIVLIYLYKYIAEDFNGVITPTQLTEIEQFITKKDNTIKILPDTTFAIYSKSNSNSLNKEYVSDVTEYGCLNYVSLSAFGVYLAAYRANSNLFTFKINEDMVMLPELQTRYYENSSARTINSRSKKACEAFNSMTKSELEFFKPLLFDNFGDEFSFTRTMQVCIFANMLNEHDSSSYTYGSYKQYLVDSYSMQTDISKSGTTRSFDYIQVFFVNVLYPRMLSENIITADEIHTVEDSFNRAYTDYECLLSLR